MISSVADPDRPPEAAKTGTRFGKKSVTAIASEKTLAVTGFSRKGLRVNHLRLQQLVPYWWLPGAMGTVRGAKGQAKLHRHSGNTHGNL